MDSQNKNQDARSRNWVATANNYDDALEEALLAEGEYSLIGREVGELGTPHLQCTYLKPKPFINLSCVNDPNIKIGRSLMRMDIEHERVRRKHGILPNQLGFYDYTTVMSHYFNDEDAKFAFPDNLWSIPPRKLGDTFLNPIDLTK